MQPSNRIIVNTAAGYVRTLLNLFLSLYSVRLVLDILGESDYGIYMLIGGVVSMLSFFTTSLIGSTQRFLSVSQGEGDMEKTRSVFRDSLLVHIVLGLLVVVVLEAIVPLLFNGFLNIPAGRTGAAVTLYQLVVVMIVISFIAAPYRALLVSRENIVYTSMVDVLIGVVKVLLVLLLPYITWDKLVGYGCVMLTLSVIEILSFSLYGHARYPECRLPRLRSFNREYAGRLASFSGWLTFNLLSVMVRNQGLAVILNRFLGTVVNAAYGLSIQISSMIGVVGGSLAYATTPQMMAAEGAGNRDRMWLLATLQSKFSFLLVSFVGIPTMFVMQPLLELWLGKGNVPQYTVMFACMFVVMQTIDMLASGVFDANKAMGKVRKFIFWTSMPNILVLPFCWLATYLRLPVAATGLLMVLTAVAYTLLRLLLTRRTSGFNLEAYCREVILKPLPPVAVSLAACVAWTWIPDFTASFLLIYVLSMPLFALTAFRWSLSEKEKEKVKSMLSRIIR